MNGAELALEWLLKENVDTVFGYPSESTTPIFEALDKCKGSIYLVEASHEQGVIHAADGFARSTGKTGVCVIGAGPGATNALSGIENAHRDAVPMVILRVHYNESEIESVLNGEIDCSEIRLPNVKKNYYLNEQKDIPFVIKEAFKISRSGIKGPVIIDITMNILKQEVNFNSTRDPRLWEVDLRSYEFRANKNIDETIKKAVSMISRATKPIIFSGGGVKADNASALLVEFAEKLDIPVIHSLKAVGTIDSDHRLNLGLAGEFGTDEANYAYVNSDLIIAIGARCRSTATGKKFQYKNPEKLIHIDINEEEIDRKIKADLAIVGKAKRVLKSLISESVAMKNPKWLEEIKTMAPEGREESPEYNYAKQCYIDVIKTINSLVERNGKKNILVSDAGIGQFVTAKYWKFSNPKDFLTPCALQNLEYGVGASIGAIKGKQDKNVVLFTRSECFRANVNELVTIKKENLPILIVLINDEELGIENSSCILCKNSDRNLGYEVDNKKLAEAFGIDGVRVKNTDEIKEALEKFDFDRPFFLEYVIDK